MRLLFAGTPTVALPALDALLGSEHEVVAVLTRPDAPAGRGRRSAASPVRERAEAAGVPVLAPGSLRDPEVQDEIRALAVDCAPVVAYGGLVPPALLDVPTHGWVNLHFSLLPAWRGAAPVQHALLHGDEVTGATTFRLEAGLDTGPVFGTLTETIRPDDTSGVLLDRLASAGAGLLVATLDGLAAGELLAVPQPTDDVSLAPRLSTEDARVRWDHPALAVDRRIRACTPAPGAWTLLPDGARLKLAPVRLRPEVTHLAPGALEVTRTGVLVGTAGHAVELERGRPGGPAEHGRRGLGPRGATRRGREARMSADERRDRSGRERGRARAEGRTRRTAAAPAARARTGDPARAAAFEVLRQVDGSDAYANLVLPPLLRSRGITGRDAAFATELAYGTLRMRGRYDAILRIAAGRPVDRLDAPVLDVLRLGAHQLLGMRVPAHAAVSETVALTRAVVGAGPAQLVNAALRRVSEQSLAQWLDRLAAEATDETERLAVAQSHPGWVVRALRAGAGRRRA